MKSYQTLKVDIEESIVTLTLNRPEEANGLNLRTVQELVSVAHECNHESVKAIILTGKGRFFCAGGDVKEMATYDSLMKTRMQVLVDQFHEAIATFASLDVPIIVAVNGMAAGGGFSLSLIGDLVIASENASFTMAYSKVGLSPDGASSYYLPRIIGLRKAQELMYTNRILNAQDALEWGLINKVTPETELIIEAKKLAEIFIQGAASSNACIKKLLKNTFDHDLLTQMEIEGRYISECADSENGLEGINAFMNKRAPNFN